MVNIANQDVCKVLAKLYEWWTRMEQAGLDFNRDLQAPIDKPSFRQQLVDFWKSGGIELETESQRNAREIMGDNFLGIHDLMHCFRVKLDGDYLLKMAKIPFSYDTLKKYKSTHILFPGYPLTLCDLFDLKRMNYRDHAYKDAEFMKLKVSECWYLLRRGPYPKTNEESFEMQKLLVEEDKLEEVPHLCELTFGVMLFALAKSMYLDKYRGNGYERVFYRLRSIDLWERESTYISQIFNDPTYIDVIFESSELRSSNVGISSCVKLQD